MGLGIHGTVLAPGKQDHLCMTTRAQNLLGLVRNESRTVVSAPC